MLCSWLVSFPTAIVSGYLEAKKHDLIHSKPDRPSHSIAFAGTKVPSIYSISPLPFCREFPHLAIFFHSRCDFALLSSLSPDLYGFLPAPPIFLVVIHPAPSATASCARNGRPRCLTAMAAQNLAGSLSGAERVHLGVVRLLFLRF